MKNNVLVCVTQGAIEDDVIATVQDVHPDPIIHIAANADDIPAVLDQHRGWAWAVLDLPTKDLQATELRDGLARNQTLPVVLAEEMDGEPYRNWVFLDPPFTTEMLRAALERTKPY